MTNPKTNKSNLEVKVNWLSKMQDLKLFEFGKNNINSMKHLLIESPLVSN